jgi:[acyl-carrier-protein] S-malonyltransferase
VEFMKAEGVTQTLELGTGKVLSGLIKRIATDIETLSIATPRDIENMAKAA